MVTKRVAAAGGPGGVGAGKRQLCRWTFDDRQGVTAVDSMGYSNGAIHGAEWDAGRIGSALRFDGVDDYVDLGEAAQLRTEVFSLTAWIKTSLQEPLWQTVMSFERGSHAISLLGNGHVHYGWQWVRKGLEGKTDVRTGEWVFIGVTRDDGGRVVIYVNGEIDGDYECDTTSVFDRSPKIGGDTIDDEFFCGLIDDVRFFNYALSKDEVGKLFVGKELLEAVKPPEEGEAKGKATNVVVFLVILAVVVMVALLGRRRKK